jgi:hypothetical protein
MPEIRVMVFEPGKPGEVRTIDGSLESFQGIVGGYIELLRDRKTGLSLYINEEGRLKDLPFNRIFGGYEVVGPAVFHRAKGENEASLTDEDIVALRRAYD